MQNFAYFQANVTHRVIWLVCLSVCWSRPWAVQNGWTDQNAVWGRDSSEPEKPFITWRYT